MGTIGLFITHNSLKGRVRDTNDNMRKIGSAATTLLARAGRVRPVPEFLIPFSPYYPDERRVAGMSMQDVR